ncbi:hypothetical protein BDV18DRAFT_4822 [Aspergillus unguis]
MPINIGPLFNGDLNADNAALHHVLVAFVAVALCNSVELLFWIFNFFKRRQGLYFWSLLVATLSVLALSICVILGTFNEGSVMAHEILYVIIQPTLLLAQSLVLYSRMHLIIRERTLNVVFWFIIISSLAIYTTFVLVIIGTATKGKYFRESLGWIHILYVYASPAARDAIFCGIYIFEAVRQLKPVINLKGRAGRTVMIHLILVNSASIVLDIMVALFYWVFYAWWTARGFWGSTLGLPATCFAMSIKLKMEFTVLNRLVDLLQAPTPPPALPSFINPDGTQAQITAAAASTGIRSTSSRVRTGSIRAGTGSLEAGSVDTGGAMSSGAATMDTGDRTESVGVVAERVKLPERVYQNV